MTKGFHVVFDQPGTWPATSVFCLSTAIYVCADLTTTFYDEARPTINFHKAYSHRAFLFSSTLYNE